MIIFYRGNSLKSDLRISTAGKHLQINTFKPEKTTISSTLLIR